MRGCVLNHLTVYAEPHAKSCSPGIKGIYIDLRRKDSVSPAMVVDAIKSCGIDPKDLGEEFKIVALIDPEKPPQGLDLISSLWSLVVALDLELLRATKALRLAQRTFRSVAVRIHGKHLHYNLGLIALTVPDMTIIPIHARSMIKDLKAYAGASAGKIFIEACEEEAVEEVSPIIDGIIRILCR